MTFNLEIYIAASSLVKPFPTISVNRTLAYNLVVIWFKMSFFQNKIESNCNFSLNHPICFPFLILLHWFLFQSVSLVLSLSLSRVFLPKHLCSAFYCGLASLYRILSKFILPHKIAVGFNKTQLGSSSIVLPGPLYILLSSFVEEKLHILFRPFTRVAAECLYCRD